MLAAVASRLPARAPVPLFERARPRTPRRAPVRAQRGATPSAARATPRRRSTACSVGPSPFWLRYRLHVLGLRAINNAVDVTNLVLLEYGYPMHAFDLDLRARSAASKCAGAGRAKRMRTLDGVERALTPTTW